VTKLSTKLSYPIGISYAFPDPNVRVDLHLLVHRTRGVFWWHEAECSQTVWKYHSILFERVDTAHRYNYQNTVGSDSWEVADRWSQQARLDEAQYTTTPLASVVLS
jgi:hypothetical protein